MQYCNANLQMHFYVKFSQRNILTIGSIAQRVPKVMDVDGFVSHDAGDADVNKEDSNPDEETHECTEKKRQNHCFPLCR